MNWIKKCKTPKPNENMANLSKVLLPPNRFIIMPPIKLPDETPIPSKIAPTKPYISKDNNRLNKTHITYVVYRSQRTCNVASVPFGATMFAYVAMVEKNIPNVKPCISSIGSTHHGFVKIEYKYNRILNANKTNVIECMCPICLINHPDMKKNGNSPPMH